MLLSKKSRELHPRDKQLVEKALSIKQELPVPIYSRFRVVCLLSFYYRSDQQHQPAPQLHHVVGLNTETCFIGGAICAERSALSHLSSLPRAADVIVEKVYLVSDARSILTPGPLCREYLIDQLPVTTPVLMAASLTNWCERTLEELYPHPCIFRGIGRGEVLEVAKAHENSRDLRAHLYAGVQDADTWHMLVLEALKATQGDINNPTLGTCTRLGAAIQMSNGRVISTHQTKAIEFGASLDGVSKALILAEEHMGSGNVKAEKLVQVDQLGIIHAPFAPARSYLMENGFEDLEVLVEVPTQTDPAIVEFHSIKARCLLPFQPRFERQIV